MGVMNAVNEQHRLAREVMKEWAKGEQVHGKLGNATTKELKERISASYETKGLRYDKPSVLTGAISNPTAETAAKIERLREELTKSANEQLDRDTRSLTIYNATEVFLNQIDHIKAAFLRDCYRIPEGRRITYTNEQLSEMYGIARSTVYAWELAAIDELLMRPGFERVMLLVKEMKKEQGGEE